MKTLLRIVLSLIGLAVLLALGAFADGAIMPEDHSVSITGTVNAAPDKVFSIITNVAQGATWRPEVKSVQVLPKNNTRDAWIEDIGSGQTMQFLATTTAPPDASGKAMRVVETNGPVFGGKWTYELSPGPSPNTTTLKITEDGYIKSPIFRFVMAHIMGPTKNLDDYMRDLQHKATS